MFMWDDFVDGNSMTYEVTIDDPTMFTRPWTMRVAEKRRSGTMGVRVSRG